MMEEVECVSHIISYADVLRSLTSATGESLEGKMLISVGASMFYSDHFDIASSARTFWDLLLREPQLNLRMVAYEGLIRSRRTDLELLEHLTSRWPGSNLSARVTLLHGHLASKEIVDMLLARGVPKDPLWLRVDLASIELPVEL